MSGSYGIVRAAVFAALLVGPGLALAEDGRVARPNIVLMLSDNLG